MSRKHRHSNDELPEEAVDKSTQEKEAEIEVQIVEKEQSLEEKISSLEKEVLEWKDKYLRSIAEFENYRRRSIQEKSDWIRLSTEKLALGICDVMDNFERALVQVGQEHLEDTMIKGFVLIEQQLRSVLAKEGVKKIEALGKEFDPSYHEALAHIPSDFDENVVAAVIQNGYTMNDKLIRPVRVAVSNGIKPEIIN